MNNLPFTCTEAMIRNHFKAALGDASLIDEVRLIRSPTTGVIKGFAYVQVREKWLVSQVIT